MSRVFQWIIKANDLQRLIAAGLSPVLLKQVLPTARVGYGATSVPLSGPGLGGAPWVIYTSYDTLAADFASGALPGPFTGIIFDLESWNLTPATEAAHPGFYTSQAAQLAHCNRMQIIATPAMNLVPPPVTPASYLASGNGHDGAMVSDGLVIQAQRYDRDPPTYTSFVGSAAAQARHAHPGGMVMAGLSTCWGGTPATAAQLFACLQGTNIAGYWLNVPIWPDGSGCAPQGCPQVAIDFLGLVYPDLPQRAPSGEAAPGRPGRVRSAAGQVGSEFYSHYDIVCPVIITRQIPI